MELSTWLSSIGNSCLFFNQTCFLCRRLPQRRAGLCHGCLEDLPRISPACRRCALPVEGGEQLICGRCLRKPPAFDSCSAAFAYRFPLNQLIPRIKYRRQPADLGWLADAMAVQLDRQPVPDALLPVPLAPARLRRRGYNQAQLLADRLGRRLALPVDRHSLTKPRDTRHQMELVGAERRRNLQGAFRWSGPAYGRIALIDDVMTTGTTASEIATLLKKAGVGTVDVWVLARTPVPSD